MDADEVVEIANEIQERLAGLPLLPGDDLARIADSIDAPVLVKGIDLSHVLVGPTMSFLLAGPEDVDGTPAFVVTRTMTEFWDRAKAPTFKAYRAACEEAWTSAGLPETDVDRMSELLTREARERQVYDDTPVQPGGPASPDAHPEPDPAQAGTADFMTAAELDAVLAPSWDDGPQAVTQIMEAAGWKRESISTQNTVFARPRGRDPLRMLVSKDGQLNGVMISEKPDDGDLPQLADRMAAMVTKAVGAAPGQGQAGGKRTWQVPGRTIAVVPDSTTVDLTIVRNGTQPFIE